MTRRVGLLGGTFDPPHVGHLVVAREVLEALELDEMRLVVAGDPPHKGPPGAPAEARARMVEASLREAEGDAAGGTAERSSVVRVDRVELEREGPSWTVETLRALRQREPGTEWFLVIGADQLAELATWREPEAIAEMATLVVVPRGGRHPDEVEAGVDVPRITTVSVTRMDVSSTDLRGRIREGRPVRWLVPDAALAIVDEEGFYADGED